MSRWAFGERESARERVGNRKGSSINGGALPLYPARTLCFFFAYPRCIMSGIALSHICIYSGDLFFCLVADSIIAFACDIGR